MRSLTTMPRASTFIASLVLGICATTAGPSPVGCTDGKCLRNWFKAVMAHDLEVVDSLLQAGVNVDVQDRDGQTALMYATVVEWRDRRIAERLLAAGANVNVMGRHGSTALRNTIGIGGAGQDTVLFRLLLEHGIDANASCAECCDRTAFLHTCMWGTPAMVSAMLAKGAHVNAVDCEGRDALMHAVEGRNAPVVRLLLDTGADAGAVDGMGRSVLEHAKRVGDETILGMLKSAGAPESRLAAPADGLYGMGRFTVSAGEEFLRAVARMDTVSRISIIDCRRDRNEYQVNRRWVFADTLQVEHPNLVNYVTLSEQLQVEPAALLAAIRAFDAMKVNEYHRMDGYVYLKVAVGFTSELGYVHVLETSGQLGTKLPYSGACLLLKRDLGQGWFEVEGDACGP